MSAVEFKVERDSLTLVTLQLARDVPAEVRKDLEDSVAEGYVRFVVRLKGATITERGASSSLDRWPVGRVRNLGKTSSPKERYVAHTDPKGKTSGRSLSSWRVTQDGLSLTASNDATSARGVAYAQYAHLPGRDPGDGAKQAFRVFGEELDGAVEEMADRLEAYYGGR